MRSEDVEGVDAEIAGPCHSLCFPSTSSISRSSVTLSSLLALFSFLLSVFTLTSPRPALPPCHSLFFTNQAHISSISPSQGATKSAVTAYQTMAATPEWKNPISWTSPPSPSTSLTDHLLSYHLVFLPGGHDKGVRQVIDSPVVASALSSYFPLTNKDKVRQTGDIAKKSR
jgi:hypothetical protein